MKFVFLFFHLLLLWTCAFADVQEVSYFTLLHAYLFIILTQSVGSDVLFSLSPLTTSMNLCIRLCSACKLLFFTLLLLSLWQNVRWVAWNLSLSILATFVNWKFTYAQHVSYFSLDNFYHSEKKCGEWHEICFHLSLLATFVNLCIHLCLQDKILCYLVFFQL